jgi:hypothetical protein
MKRLLYISGSVGLSHVTRDLAIARSLKRIIPGLEIFWLADEPALSFLVNSGEKVLPGSHEMNHGNKILDEPEYEGYEFNVMKWYSKYSKGMGENATKILTIANEGGYDLIVGDEAYDLMDAFQRDITKKKVPVVSIIDFLAIDRATNSPYDFISTYYANYRYFVKRIKARPPVADKWLIIGDMEDFKDKRYGIFLPKRLELAKKHLQFVGYPMGFNPREYQNPSKVKKDLGYGNEPLLLCSKGSTKAGKVLFDLIIKTYPLIHKELPNLRMILVLGPSISLDKISVPDGVELKGYVPELYKHMAAADLNICQPGLGTIMELISLERPFLYFPLEKHFEHEEIAYRCKVHNAGVRMDFLKTKPLDLANAVIENIGRKVDYRPIDTNGADRAAKAIAELF